MAVVQVGDQVVFVVVDVDAEVALVGVSIVLALDVCPVLNVALKQFITNLTLPPILALSLNLGRTDLEQFFIPATRGKKKCQFNAVGQGQT